MKNIGKDIKSGIIMAITFTITLGLIGSIYAAWTDISSLKVNSNDILSSSTWNEAMDNFELLRNSQSVPAGGVLAFALEECPIGWMPANGENGTPDLRGRFIRGLNSFENGANLGYENDGITLRDSNKGIARTLMSYQGDAIRNITGTIDFQWNVSNGFYSLRTTGAFYNSSNKVGRLTGEDVNGIYAYTPYFDASRVVPVGDDNHPKNVALIYCIKD